MKLEAGKRYKHQSLPSEIKDVNLDGCTFEYCDFTECRIMNTSLIATMFHKCAMSSTLFSGCRLRTATVTGAIVSSSKFEHCDFSNTKIYTSLFDDTGFVNCDFKKSRLLGLKFTSSSVVNCELRDVNMSTTCQFYDTRFTGSTLPHIDGIDAIRGFRTEVLAPAIKSVENIDMATWHTCDTVHCLAGWICHLHPQGKTLETLLGPATAASFILSNCNENIPDFYKVSPRVQAHELALRWIQTGELNVA